MKYSDLVGAVIKWHLQTNTTTPLPPILSKKQWFFYNEALLKDIVSLTLTFKKHKKNLWSNRAWTWSRQSHFYILFIIFIIFSVYSSQFILPGSSSLWQTLKITWMLLKEFWSTLNWIQKRTWRSILKELKTVMKEESSTLTMSTLVTILIAELS